MMVPTTCGNPAKNAVNFGRSSVIVPHQSVSSPRCSSLLPSAPRCLLQRKHTQRAQALPSGRARSLRCRAESENQDPPETSSSPSSSNGSPASSEGGDRIKSTLSGLDFLLGIDPEEEKRLKDKANKPDKRPLTAVSVAPGVLEQLAKAEADRKQNGAKAAGVEMTDKELDEADARISDVMSKIVEKAKQLASEPGSIAENDEKELQGQFSELLDIMRTGADDVDKEHVERIKKEAFGPATFYVTETRLGGATDMTNGTVPTMGGGLLVRGNLRTSATEAFEFADAAITRMFGERYEVLMIPDAEAEEPDPRGGPRVAFQIVLSSSVRPTPATGLQSVFAGTLLLFTLASCLQLGLAANVHLLPKETLDWLANPENAGSNLGPPGITDFDAVPYFSAALPIALSTYAAQLIHELGHRVAASMRKVKLGPSFLIPNSQIGTFGAVTAFKSMVRTRSDMFDVTVAGPAAGGITALILFGLGLYLTVGGSDTTTALVPVPATLFQGSLLLGGTVKAVLGEVALNRATVAVHPLLIAGWCGLVSTALNLLPVGAIDGGRMMQAAFGRSALSFSSFLTYVGLGFGLLGSSLALPFGLFVLIVQREVTGVIKDNVTVPSEERRTLAAILFAITVLVLLPMAPDVADFGNDNLFL